MSTPSSAYGSSLTVLVESTSLAPASGSPFQPWAADKGFNPFQYIETQRTDAQDLAQARQLELCDELAATQAKMDKLKTIQHRLAKEDHSQPMVASRIVSAWTQNTLGRAADVVRETKEEAQVITEQIIVSGYEYNTLSQQYEKLQGRCEVLRQVALDQDALIERTVGFQPSIEEAKLQLQILKEKASGVENLESEIARLKQKEANYEALQRKTDGPNGLRAKAAKYDELEKTFGNLNHDERALPKRRSKRFRTEDA